MHVSIPTIGIKIFFKYYSEIGMRTIDVALSADLNDRVVFMIQPKNVHVTVFSTMRISILLMF